MHTISTIVSSKTITSIYIIYLPNQYTYELHIPQTMVMLVMFTITFSDLHDTPDIVCRIILTLNMLGQILVLLHKNCMVVF